MFSVCLMFKPCLKVHWHLRLVELLRLSLCGWWWFFLVLKNRNSSEMNFVSIFAARKPSLRQGNIFRSACHSGHSGEEVCIQGGGICLQGGGLGRPPPPRIRKAGGTHPTGMLSCLWLRLWFLFTPKKRIAFVHTIVIAIVQLITDVNGR